jgi:uncharacterized protein (DUF2236 family)
LQVGAAGDGNNRDQPFSAFRAARCSVHDILPIFFTLIRNWKFCSVRAFRAGPVQLVARIARVAVYHWLSGEASNRRGNSAYLGTRKGKVCWTGRRRKPKDVLLLSEDDFESSLDAVCETAAGPIEGIFGPASLTWRVDREAAVFLGAGRALLLQLAHPWVAAGIAEHSRTLADPIGRFHQTFNTVFTMVFGTLDQALAAARRLHRRHAAVTGILPWTAGRFAAGSVYRANEISALRWVHATLVETALLTHDLVLPALTNSEREKYWAEGRLFAALFGLRQADLPPDWTSFTAYNEAMWRSDILTVSPAARKIAEQIFLRRATGLRVPKWYLALTTQLLPERLRGEFGLSFGEREQRSMDLALARIRRLYPRLPLRLRAVGPYQEAMARLQGKRQPDLAVRSLNRLWIGRPMME